MFISVTTGASTQLGVNLLGITVAGVISLVTRRNLGKLLRRR